MRWFACGEPAYLSLQQHLAHVIIVEVSPSLRELHNYHLRGQGKRGKITHRQFTALGTLVYSLDRSYHYHRRSHFLDYKHERVYRWHYLDHLCRTGTAFLLFSGLSHGKIPPCTPIFSITLFIATPTDRYSASADRSSSISLPTQPLSYPIHDPRKSFPPIR